MMLSLRKKEPSCEGVRNREESVMDINEVLKRANNDPLFEAQLRGDAAKASQDGIGSEAFASFMSNFAESPAELRDMRAIGEGRDVGVVGWDKTILTTTTITSLGCTTTTTTTTTTWVQPQAQPQGPVAPQ
jgi:hypothetical protein